MSANDAIDFIYRYYGVKESVSNNIKNLQKEGKLRTAGTLSSSKQDIFMLPLGFCIVPFFSII